MPALVHLRKAPAPKIFLTATLVPDHEKVLAEFVGISHEQSLVLRSPTARPNHRLQIAAIPLPHTPFTTGLRLASLLMDTWDDRAIRGIIFVRSLLNLDNVSSSAPFPVCTFHGGMSGQEKDTQLDSWLSEGHPARWMISTTALLHGVDYPRVDAVIFLESPFGLYDFVQGAGRAGRSGQESFIAVLHNGVPRAPRKKENKYACRVEMEGILLSAVCRRLSISRVMDKDETSCSELPSSLPCDICEGHISPLITGAINTPLSAPITTAAVHNPAPRSPPRPSPTTLLNAFTAQSNTVARRKHGESIKDLMERYSGCFTCRLKSNDHNPCHTACGNSGVSGCRVTAHLPYSCTNFHYNRGWIDWKKTFKWPRDVVRCHFCGFPDTVVPYSHKKGGYPGICRYSDTALVASWHILHTPLLFAKLREELNFVPGTDIQATFGVWLTEYGSDSEEIRLLSVFSWLCRQYFPDRPHSG